MSRGTYGFSCKISDYFNVSKSRTVSNYVNEIWWTISPMCPYFFFNSLADFSTMLRLCLII